MSTVETHTMPNGQTVYYRDSDHAYWTRHLDGKCSGRIPGISGISKCDGDTYNDPLIDWGARLSCEGVARELSLALSLEDPDDMRSALSWCETGNSIWETLKQEKLTWKHIREEAGTRGSIAHGILSDLAEGKVPRPQSPYDEATISWWNATDPIPIMVEQVVYDAERGFAGRFDLFYGDGPNGVLADLKTSKWISGSFAVQLNLYRVAMIAAGFPAPDRLAVIQVREDASWAEIPIPVREDWALNALATYKMGREIGSVIRAARKQAEQGRVAA